MINLDLIKTTIDELLVSNNYELAKFEYVKQGSDNVLRIEVSSEKAISMDDIVKVTNLVSDKLDEIDTSDDSYLLDISSSGIEKPIKIENLKNHLDDYVNITLIEPYKELVELEGKIIEVNDDGITLQFFIKGAKKKLVIDYKNIKSARNAIKF